LIALHESFFLVSVGVSPDREQPARAAGGSRGLPGRLEGRGQAGQGQGGEQEAEVAQGDVVEVADSHGALAFYR